MNYLYHLMDNMEYGDAAKVCFQVLGTNNIQLWEEVVSRQVIAMLVNLYWHCLCMRFDNSLNDSSV